MDTSMRARTLMRRSRPPEAMRERSSGCQSMQLTRPWCAVMLRSHWFGLRMSHTWMVPLSKAAPKKFW